MPFEIIRLPSGKFTVRNRITSHDFIPTGTTLQKAKAQLRQLTAKMHGAGQGNDMLYRSMSDEDLNAYFPGARVVKYSEIPGNIPMMDWLKSGEVVFVLYEQAPNEGHWCGICRDNKAVYYFDSYGNKPCQPLSWNTAKVNAELRQDPAVLVNMCHDCPLPVYFNDEDYQSHRDGVSTCGRWVTMWFSAFKRMGCDLKAFKKIIQAEQRETGKGADELVIEAVH